VLVVGVLNDTLGEPESDFLLSRLDGVGAVADVAASDEAVITTDGSRSRCQRVGGTEHRTASLDGVETFDHKSDDRSRCHVLDESREEGLVVKISIVLA